MEDLSEEVAALDGSLDRLGVQPENDTLTWPKEDARFDRLVELIEEHLRADNEWRDDERLIVFTEYKTTLDYLDTRLSVFTVSI